MNTPKIGQTYLTGRVKGIYDKDSKSFKIKKAKTKNDKKYQVFEIAVSKKDQDGNWTNGQNIRVTLFGETPVADKQAIGLIGSFEPNNYEKDGKTVYGLQFTAFEIFEPASWDSKQESKPKDEKEDNPWS